ncbi:hypothetical protein TNCV_4401901 [Trichonephila clavipes]|nr:hypothetical protein TNCV_4401901 [Trichonephila clavipes]
MVAYKKCQIVLVANFGHDQKHVDSIVKLRVQVATRSVEDVMNAKLVLTQILPFGIVRKLGELSAGSGDFLVSYHSLKLGVSSEKNLVYDVV